MTVPAKLVGSSYWVAVRSGHVAAQVRRPVGEGPDGIGGEIGLRKRQGRGEWGGHQYSQSDPLPLRPVPRAVVRIDISRDLRALQLKEGGVGVGRKAVNARVAAAPVALEMNGKGGRPGCGALTEGISVEA